MNDHGHRRRDPQTSNLEDMRNKRNKNEKKKTRTKKKKKKKLGQRSLHEKHRAAHTHTHTALSTFPDTEEGSIPLSPPLPPLKLPTYPRNYRGTKCLPPHGMSYSERSMGLAMIPSGFRVVGGPKSPPETPADPERCLLRHVLRRVSDGIPSVMLTSI